MTFAGHFMMEREIENCIIVGAGMGLSASLASLFLLLGQRVGFSFCS